MEQNCKVKFKIISLKVNGPTEYIPELVSLLFPSHFNLILEHYRKMNFSWLVQTNAIESIYQIGK